jgi:hypothetical protein
MGRNMSTAKMLGLIDLGRHEQLIDGDSGEAAGERESVTHGDQTQHLAVLMFLPIRGSFSPGQQTFKRANLRAISWRRSSQSNSDGAFRLPAGMLQRGKAPRGLKT